MMQKIFYIPIFIAILGCGDLRIDDQMNYGNSDFQGDKAVLVAKQWKLETYETGKPTFVSILEFKAEKNPNGEGYILSGRSAVNFYEANYVLLGTNSIKVNGLSVTEIAVSMAEGNFEDDFFKRVSSVENFTIGQNELLLSNSKGMKMRFINNN